MRTNQDDHDMFNHLENFGMIDNMLLDLIEFKLKNRGLAGAPYALWQLFIRTEQ